jgi:hypothetical protein
MFGNFGESARLRQNDLAASKGGHSENVDGDDFRYWPTPDILIARANVCFRG